MLVDMWTAAPNTKQTRAVLLLVVGEEEAGEEMMEREEQEPFRLEVVLNLTAAAA